MGKCNIEGYRDLTAYYAIINVSKETETTNPNRGKPSHINQKSNYTQRINAVCRYDISTPTLKK